MLPFPLPGQKVLPDVQTNTEAWWKETDRLTKSRFDPTKPLEFDFNRDQPDSFFASIFNEDALRETIDARRMICDTQFEISRVATDLLIGDFADKWIALGKTRRTEIFLSAFRTQEANGAGALLNSQTEKLSCPELLKEELEKDDGEGFLNLLKRFLLDNNDVFPPQPFVLENPMFDRLIGYKKNEKTPARKGWLEFKRLLRTHYICNYIVQPLYCILTTFS